ncbi:P-loop containing nucleoside triphosphate hydrolase protein [Pelagophyceae sp. CCMP2097]|nr:P-loop containing nucleoside triphosphate hydrolase protein [Pelagophyceae sp. CCMP2097]
MAESRVKVAVRVRPLLPGEVQRGCDEGLFIDEKHCILRLSGNKSFEFPDGVFGGAGRHAEVYAATAAPLIDRLFEGFNATVLAYGQTGSGKTYTMGTAFEADADIDGVVPRAIAEVFDRCDKAAAVGVTAVVTCSLLEVYNEDVRDLLSPSREPLAVRDAAGAGAGVVIHGLSEHTVKYAHEVFKMLKRGLEERVTGATDMNAHSSRSHMILTFKLEVADAARGRRTVSKLHLVDLAGSERAKRTGATGERLKEGIGINKSLLALGNVIARLVELGDRNGDADVGRHVPYRDSALTRVLADSLGGSAMTCMIACASPNSDDSDESANTFRWASRATKITNIARTNVVVDAHADALAAAERAELASLRDQNKFLREKNVEILLEAEKASKVLRCLKKANAKLDRRCLVLTKLLPAEAAAEAFAALETVGDAPNDGDDRFAVIELGKPEDAQRPRLGSGAGDDDDDDGSDDNSDSDGSDDGEDADEAALAAMKELRSLEMEEECMENLRVHYEHAIAKLEKEVNALEVERHKLLTLDGKPVSGASAALTDKATRVLREKARELERRLENLRKEAERAKSEVARCSKLKSSAEDEARRLRAVVQEAQRCKGHMHRMMQQEDKKKALELQKWRREARRLAHETERVQGENAKMSERHRVQDQTRKRQLEEERSKFRRARGMQYGSRRAPERTQSKTRAPMPRLADSALFDDLAGKLPDWLKTDLDRRFLRLLGDSAPETTSFPLSLSAEALGVMQGLAETAALQRFTFEAALRRHSKQTEATRRQTQLDAREQKVRTSEKLDALMSGVSSIKASAVNGQSGSANGQSGSAPAAFEDRRLAATAPVCAFEDRRAPASVTCEKTLRFDDDGNDAFKTAIEDLRSKAFDEDGAVDDGALFGELPAPAAKAEAASAPLTASPPAAPLTAAQNSSKALEEYSARRTRMRKSMGGTERQSVGGGAFPDPEPLSVSDERLEEVNTKVQAVQQLLSGMRAHPRSRAEGPRGDAQGGGDDEMPSARAPRGASRDPAAARELAPRDYAKPWLYNAKDTSDHASVDDMAPFVRGHKDVDYERPWRVNAKLHLRPPPADDAASKPKFDDNADAPPPPQFKTHEDRVPLGELPRA